MITVLHCPECESENLMAQDTGTIPNWICNDCGFVSSHPDEEEI